MSVKKLIIFISLGLITLTACQQAEPQKPATLTLLPEFQDRLNIYDHVPLTADISHLSTQQKEMLGLFIEAADIMDALFWQQAFGQDKHNFLAQIPDLATRNFAEYNYGPWDRLAGDKPFLAGFSNKPLGAQFYPENLSKKEFEQAQLKDKQGLYSIIERNTQGELYSIPYSEKYHEPLLRVAAILEKAAKLAEDPNFANYLNLRAKALLRDNYQASDLAWMDMKENLIDFIVGPIETYEDQLFGYRAAFEAYILLKDTVWSEKLTKYVSYLPELQKSLPVSSKYKKEAPGLESQLNAYDVIYYAGHANAGGKTIAINLPNDEQVQLAKGTRRLQLKNAMQAKFDRIVSPIANTLIAPEQRANVTFDAFFANTMFHEVAHGLGIKNTINNQGTVREALKEHASALEEGKADILGLFMVEKLLNKGVIEQGTLEQYYTTFLTSIFRSIRFGASSAHGKANMIRFNYFAEQGAFTRNEQGFYQINKEKMSEAVQALSKLILTLQGDGDYDSVAKLVAEKGMISEQLQQDLNRLAQANIPVDIVFEQGKKVLGL